ncbi:MAG: cytochrome b6-f complex iron-sulfur subunit, partial [Candidatus Latescibacterota bacterium]
MSDRLAPKPVPRRDFLGLAGLWAAGLAIFGSLLGMARLAKPSVLPEASKRFRIGRPEDFAVDGAKIIAGRNVHLVAKDGAVAAVSLVCTHLGCIVNTTETGYSCPCHGSVFDNAGDVVGGPAPRGLRWLAVSLAADGSLIVDANKEVAS